MRLIDADLPMEQMEKLLDHHLMMGNFSADGAVSDCIEFLKTAPTIDAEPVRHGHWVWGSAWYPPTCSVCNLVPLTPGYVGDVNFYERYFNRCPNCGAKMDEVSE